MALFARREPRPTASLPSDTVVYAVGDIHGRLDLLDKLLAWVEDDFDQTPPDTVAFLIFLGDYIDRGPESRGVIERLSSLAPPALSVVALKGNHEQMLIDVLAEPAKAAAWSRVGGQATMLSYGVAVPMQLGVEDRWEQAVIQLRAAITPAHLAFLENLRIAVEIGDYFFVHAGVRPDRPLDQQSETDMLWIRDRFLKHKGGFGKIIVHGHSTATEPMIAASRIGIDTGAYATGLLSCLRLEGSERRLMAVSAHGVTPWASQQKDSPPT